MQIYISSSSIINTAIQKSLSISDLPEFLTDNGFKGIEISDREILGFDMNFLHLISQKCFQNNCGLILDVNVDLKLIKFQFFDIIPGSLLYTIGMMNTAKRWIVLVNDHSQSSQSKLCVQFRNMA